MRIKGRVWAGTWLLFALVVAGWVIARNTSGYVSARESSVLADSIRFLEARKTDLTQRIRSAESRADFVHKLQVVLKELRESRYWLRLIQRAVPAAGADADIGPLSQEANELAKIIAKSIVTAKSR